MAGMTDGFTNKTKGTNMANENIQKLEELLRSDEEVQAQIRTAVEAYDGDKTDEQAFFEATIGKVSEAAGLPVSYEEVIAHAKKLTNLDDSELDAVAGGGGYCFIVGIHGEVDANACDEDESELGAHACAYLGVGFPYT